MLMSYGANLATRSDEMRTALEMAFEDGHKDVVSVVREKGLKGDM